MKTILVDAVHTLIIKDERKGYFVDQELLDLLNNYPNPKLIVTNADDQQLINFGLNNSPYPVFSLKNQPDKIKPLYFETLLKKYNLQSTDIIYLEHNPLAIKSAESLGIITYHYDAQQKDLLALARFIETNL